MAWSKMLTSREPKNLKKRASALILFLLSRPGDRCLRCPRREHLRIKRWSFGIPSTASIVRLCCCRAWGRLMRQYRSLLLYAAAVLILLVAYFISPMSKETVWQLFPGLEKVTQSYPALTALVFLT